MLRARCRRCPPACFPYCRSCSSAFLSGMFGDQSLWLTAFQLRLLPSHRNRYSRLQYWPRSRHTPECGRGTNAGYGHHAPRSCTARKTGGFCSSGRNRRANIAGSDSTDRTWGTVRPRCFAGRNMVALFRSNSRSGDRTCCAGRHFDQGGRRDGRFRARGGHAHLDTRLWVQAGDLRPARSLARMSRVAKPTMGVAFAFVGVFILTGFDKIVETSLTNAMPDWLTTLTTRI